MGTRSYIGRINKDNSITAIYCHLDGYPEYVGEHLINYYITSQQVDQLLNNGDMSSIGKTIADCEFYKSRGDTDVEAKQYKDFEDFYQSGKASWAEYFYLFNHDFWACWDMDKKRFDFNQLDEEKDEEVDS